MWRSITDWHSAACEGEGRIYCDYCTGDPGPQGGIKGSGVIPEAFRCLLFWLRREHGLCPAVQVPAGKKCQKNTVSIIEYPNTTYMMLEEESYQHIESG